MLRRLIKYSCIFAACMNHTLNGSSVLECGNAVEIRSGIMFDFYLGLSQLYFKAFNDQLDHF